MEEEFRVQKPKSEKLKSEKPKSENMNLPAWRVAREEIKWTPWGEKLRVTTVSAGGSRCDHALEEGGRQWCDSRDGWRPVEAKRNSISVGNMVINATHLVCSSIHRN